MKAAVLVCVNHTRLVRISCPSSLMSEAAIGLCVSAISSQYGPGRLFVTHIVAQTACNIVCDVILIAD